MANHRLIAVVAVRTTGLVAVSLVDMTFVGTHNLRMTVIMVQAAMAMEQEHIA